MRNMSKEKLKINSEKVSIYKCVHFLLFLVLSTLLIYYFHCFPISFLLLYLSFHLDSVHHNPDFLHFLHFHPDNSYFSLKTNTPLCYYCITLGAKSLPTSSETSSVISQKKYFKVPKICEV